MQKNNYFLNEIKRQIKLPPNKIAQSYLLLELKRVFLRFRFPFLFGSSFILLIIIFLIIGATFTNGFKSEINNNGQIQIGLDTFYNAIQIPLVSTAVSIGFIFAFNIVSYLFRIYSRSKSDLLLIEKELSRFWILNLRHLISLTISILASLSSFLAIFIGFAFVKETINIEALNYYEITIKSSKFAAYIFLSILLFYLIDLGFLYWRPTVGVIINSSIFAFALLSPIVSTIEKVFQRSFDPVKRIISSPRNSLNNNEEPQIVKLDKKSGKLSTEIITNVIANENVISFNEPSIPSTFLLQPLSLTLIGRNIIFDDGGVNIYSVKQVSQNYLNEFKNQNIVINYLDSPSVLNFNFVVDTKGKINFLSNQDITFNKSQNYDKNVENFINKNSDLFKIKEPKNAPSFLEYWKKIRLSNDFNTFRANTFAKFLDEETLTENANVLLSTNTTFESALLVYFLIEYLKNTDQEVVINANDPILKESLHTIKASKDKLILEKKITFENIISLVFDDNTSANNGQIGLIKLPDQDLKNFRNFGSFKSRGYIAFSIIVVLVTITSFIVLYYQFMFRKGY